MRQTTIGDEKIDVTVIIVVGPGAGLIITSIGDDRSGIGRRAEGSIAIVMPKEMFLVVAADEQVEISVVVIIAPGAAGKISRHCGHWTVGDLAEGSVSFIVIEKTFLASGVRDK